VAQHRGSEDHHVEGVPQRRRSLHFLGRRGRAALGDGERWPIPFFVLSPKAKVGHKSTTAFTHSSTLRTIQEIFGLTPLLRDAANATDLSEFFTSFP
jgi:hypothetical protein